jgi:hypothetical protein
MSTIGKALALIAGPAAVAVLATAAPAAALAPPPSLVTFDAVPIGSRLPLALGPVTVSLSPSGCDGTVIADPELSSRHALRASCPVGVAPVIRATFVSPQAWASAKVSPLTIPASLRAHMPNGTGLANAATFDLAPDPPRAGFWSPPVTIGLSTPRIGYVELQGYFHSLPLTVHAIASSPTPQPELELSTGPPKVTNSAAASVTFAASVPGALFHCVLDRRPPEPCTSPFAASGLSDGDHRMSVRVVGDPYNGQTDWKEHAFTVDTVPPETGVRVASAGWPYPEDAIRIQPAASETTGYECSLDGAAFTPCPPTHIYAGLPAGPHRVQVRAVDAAGNVDPTPAEASWIAGSPTPASVFDPPQPPVAGRDATLQPVSGRVLVNIKGRGFVPLNEAANVALGDVIDAREGRVTVATAPSFRPGEGSRARTDSAELAAAMFTIRQQRAARDTARTDILMRTPPGQERACASATTPPKGVVRAMTGVVKGTFRAVAGAGTVTVRDAAWTIQDTCAGTRVRARSGSVRISVKGGRRSLTVRPGHSYLIKAKLFAARQAARELRYRGANR